MTLNRQATRLRSYLWFLDCLGHLLVSFPLGMVCAQSLAGNLDLPPCSPNDPGACITVGLRYEHGVGIPQDLDRAIGRYCEAAQLGLADARYHLGWLYVSGRLGKIDEVLAAAWFKTALELGHAQAGQQLQRLGAGDLELDSNPACVFRAAMVNRRIADLRPPVSPDPPSAPAGPNPGPDQPRLREIGSADIIALVRRLAPDYHLDPNLVLAVIETESNFALDALSPRNAQGLMQLIPATAERFGVANVWDPVQNLRGGMAYLRWLLDHFDGEMELALAGYNAGEQVVARYGGIPPYPETQAYVRRIQQRLGNDSRAPAGGAVLTTAPPVADDRRS